MIIRIEIREGSHTVECSGHPLELLMELSLFFSKQEEVGNLLKYGIKLSEVVKAEFENGAPSGYIKSSEGSKIVAEFMKRYEPDKNDNVKNN